MKPYIQKTFIKFAHEYGDRIVRKTYEREGEIQAESQLVSWVRECALKFAAELKQEEQEMK